ncbi:MAG TPA: HAMP domain-containing protein [Firmicutes bacterium]|nr:HAMP domain-containing protein [Bacillota bacterium]
MLKNINIWKKIFIGFVIIAAALLLITGRVTIKQSYNNVKQQAELTLNNNLNSANRQLNRRLDNILFILNFLSKSHDIFKDRIINHDLDSLHEFIIKFKKKYGLSFVVITDPSGKIISSANNTHSYGEKLSEDKSLLLFLNGKQLKGITVLNENFLIRENLSEQAYVKIMPTSEARSYEITEERRGIALTASVPVYNDNNELIAFLLGGELLNRHTAFVDEVTEALQVSTTIFLDDLRIATSSRLDNGDRAIGTRVSEKIANIVLDRGERYLGREFILDQWYLTAYDPIFNINNDVIGILYVGIPEEPFIQMRNDAMNSFISAAVHSIMIATLLAFFIIRSITNPLHNLIDTMQKVEHGDLSHRYSPKGKNRREEKEENPFSENSPAKPNNTKLLPAFKSRDQRGDEIQQLGSFFNKMMDSLQANWQKNQELKAQLEEKERMRLYLLQKIITTQEEERKRISRELHDETGQSLTALILGLRRIQEADDINEVRKLAGDFREIVHKTLEEIQWLSFELRPSALDDLGLYAAINRYIKELSRYSDFNIEYEQQKCKDIRMNSAVETTVYRIVQEALTNVIRHAEAQNVRVSLKCDHNNIEAIIEDDGKGFDYTILQKDQHALGLFGMTERASLVGGKLVIDTAPGKGTRITLSIPEVTKFNN